MPTIGDAPAMVGNQAVLSRQVILNDEIERTAASVSVKVSAKEFEQLGAEVVEVGSELAEDPQFLLGQPSSTGRNESRRGRSDSRKGPNRDTMLASWSGSGSTPHPESHDRSQILGLEG